MDILDHVELFSCEGNFFLCSKQLDYLIGFLQWLTTNQSRRAWDIAPVLTDICSPTNLGIDKQSVIFG
jgi:hypothetical protein